MTIIFVAAFFSINDWVDYVCPQYPLQSYFLFSIKPASRTYKNSSLTSSTFFLLFGRLHDYYENFTDLFMTILDTVYVFLHALLFFRIVFTICGFSVKHEFSMHNGTAKSEFLSINCLLESCKRAFFSRMILIAYFAFHQVSQLVPSCIDYSLLLYTYRAIKTMPGERSLHLDCLNEKNEWRGRVCH